MWEEWQRGQKKEEKVEIDQEADDVEGSVES